MWIKTCRSEEAAKKEYKLGLFLYSSNISVPKFYQLERNIIQMQKIEGVECWLLEDPQEAIRQYKCEISQVLGLGIIPIESDFGDNCLFNGTLYLIDFELWRLGSKRELYFYRRGLDRFRFLHPKAFEKDFTF